MIKIPFKIVRKEGWELNPSDYIVNDIIAKLEANYGRCPSHEGNDTDHNICPCSSYLQHNKCYCQLYVKKENNNG